jgi:hypothetical protein
VRERNADTAREQAYEATSELELDRAPDPVEEQAGIDELAADHADADWIAVVPDNAPAARAPEPPEPEEEPSAEHPEPAEDAPARKKGRSSVPSWDEIMFGGGKND